MKHSASLLIQNPDGAYLVIQRSHTCNNFKGYWEFPGGKIDAGESPATALQREVREETGIEAPKFDDAQGFRIATPNGAAEYTFFAWRCDALPTVRLSDEHQAFQWLRFEAARKLSEMMQPHRQFLEQHWHQEQIKAYQQELPHYKVFAEALKRILENACAVSLPETIIQARPKSIPSFAEKCIRKMDKYPDPIRQLTDLCGGRVIVQTLEQVEAVCRFVEKHFKIVEKDDKTSHLNTDQFGYRDMHYIIQVPAGCALAFTAEERQAIGDRRAELQVRTLVQQAWADILHDRMYKTPLRLASEAKRTGNLLAAVLEDGDRGFNRLATDLDGMIANYSAYASEDNVEKEIRVQQLLVAGETKPEQQPKLALQLARLIAARGQWQQIVEILKPHANISGPLRLELLSELGHALCHLDRAQPLSADYQLGQSYLQQVIQACESPDFSSVPNLRRIRSVHARALARFGWSWEALDSEAQQAREAYRRATLIEPSEPYYFAEMIGFELRFTPERKDFAASLRPQILGALQTCREHATAGTELPFAYFTAGRLGLLADQAYAALNDYARGIRHCLAEAGTVAADVFDLEIAWLHRVYSGKNLPMEFQWVKDLLRLAKSVCPACSAPAAPTAMNPHGITVPVLIVAGGAATLPPEENPRIQALLHDPLSVAGGTVISGGTTSGVSGAVGAIARELAGNQGKHFLLLGYIPHSLPHDAEKDPGYDQTIPCGADRF
ncbi:MAG: NUDIX domain-containing protein, partial [Verrucomicrobia bacterium]|nr:NUDIX domain-containing protein [Verrucomicrobiota bacterium]